MWKLERFGFGWGKVSAATINAIAASRSQATLRSAAETRSVVTTADQSISRLRIASATAAARSETPSFSYTCCTCVLTVVTPMKSSLPISGNDFPSAISRRISRSRSVMTGPASALPAQQFGAGRCLTSMRRVCRHLKIFFSRERKSLCRLDRMY